jgi:hypothetical protein
MADFDVRLTRGAEIDLEALYGYVRDNRPPSRRIRFSTSCWLPSRRSRPFR